MCALNGGRERGGGVKKTLFYFFLSFSLFSFLACFFVSFSLSSLYIFLFWIFISRLLSDVYVCMSLGGEIDQ